MIAWLTLEGWDYYSNEDGYVAGARRNVVANGRNSCSGEAALLDGNNVRHLFSDALVAKRKPTDWANASDTDIHRIYIKLTEESNEP